MVELMREYRAFCVLGFIINAIGLVIVLHETDSTTFHISLTGGNANTTTDLKVLWPSRSLRPHHVFPVSQPWH